jgi:hypothetical protein
MISYGLIVVGWAKAQALLFCAAILIARRAHHLTLRMIAEGGHGAREFQYAARQCQRLCPPYSRLLFV